jgi:hypothetical protein
MNAVGERIEAERRVLSTLLLSEFGYKQLPRAFGDHCFETPEYRTLFQKLNATVIEQGQPSSIVLLTKEHPEFAALVTDITADAFHYNGDLEEYATRLQDHKTTLNLDEVETQFPPLSIDRLQDILVKTIRHDEENRLVTFLAMLSAYTFDNQMNLSFNAPSSTGKSYIATETAKLFPREDVVEIGYCSPTAFFHEAGKFEEETNTYRVDLERKILVFLDQPHQLLLEHLRPLLSHDKRELRIKITDRTKRGQHRTKNIILRGYPAVIFATAGLKLDDQELTRFLLLSPETSQDKIRDAVELKIERETNPARYLDAIEHDPQRQTLKARIESIRIAHIQEIKIVNHEMIRRLFFTEKKILKPRHSRDIGRIMGLIKSLALLNLWYREREGGTIVANEDDIGEAFRIWQSSGKAQELSLPPFVYSIYCDVIIPAYNEKNTHELGDTKDGVSRREILTAYHDTYGRPIAEHILRREVLPMLENSGLIVSESDPADKRRQLVFPTFTDRLVEK